MVSFYLAGDTPGRSSCRWRSEHPRPSGHTGPRPFGSGTSRKRPSGSSDSSVAPHSTQRRRRRDRGGKGTSPIFRLIQPCSYFLSEPPPDDVPVVEVVVGVDEVDDVEVVLVLEVDVLSEADGAPDFLLP